MSNVELALVVLLWMVLAIQFIRALRRDKLRDTRDRLAWGMCILMGLVYTLSSRTAELQLDRMLGGLPVSLYIKFIGLLLIAHFYHLTLLPFSPAPERIQWAVSVAPAVTLVLLVCFPVVAVLPVEREVLRGVLMAVRDSVLALMMVGVFLPTGLHLVQQEHILFMRVRHVASLLFEITFIVAALMSIIVAVELVLGRDAPQTLEQLLGFTVLLRAVLFLITLVPHRWLSVMLYPYRIYLLLRLGWFARRLARLTTARLTLPPRLGVEAAIYQLVIFILDSYHDLNTPEHAALFRQVDQVVQNRPDYVQLVQGLAYLQ